MNELKKKTKQLPLFAEVLIDDFWKRLVQYPKYYYLHSLPSIPPLSPSLPSLPFTLLLFLPPPSLSPVPLSCPSLSLSPSLPLSLSPSLPLTSPLFLTLMMVDIKFRGFSAYDGSDSFREFRNFNSFPVYNVLDFCISCMLLPPHHCNNTFISTINTPVSPPSLLYQVLIFILSLYKVQI